MDGQERALRARDLLLGRPCDERSGRRQGFRQGVVRLGGKGHAGRGGGTCKMLRLDGDEACGLYKMEPERREQGIPPHWFFYVSVEDADATASRARELGGMVYGEAFDVLDSGRMAVMQDPTGAMIAAWQSRAHVDANQVNDVGCLTWNELQSRDPETAAAFYTGLFGWETEPIEENGKLIYVTIKNADFENGGIMPIMEQHGDAPPHWLAYFTVPSCEDAVA